VWYLKSSVILCSSLRSTSTTDLFRQFIPYSSFPLLFKKFCEKRQKGSVQVVDMEKEENVVILDVETIQGESNTLAKMMTVILTQ
jgi:hypothetical protein